MLSVVRAHGAALLLALLVGALTAFPQLIAEKRMGDAFQGIHPVVIDDQLYYQVRAHETLDGHPTLSSPYLYEHKDTAAVGFWVPDMVLAKVSLLLGGLHVGDIVFDLVFPFLVVLLSYAILFTLSRDRLLSLALAALLDPGIAFTPFLRSPHPQLFVLLLASILATLYALKAKSRGWTIAALLLGASLFYVYPFYWTYWVVLMGIAVVGTFVFVRSTNAYRTLALILGGALVLAIPYFLESLAISKIPHYAESLKRIGVIDTHFPSGAFIILLVGAVSAAMAYAWWRKWAPLTPAALVILSSVLAGVVVVNQHVITGMSFFFTGHYTMFVEFMAVFLAAAFIPAYLTHAIPARLLKKARYALIFGIFLYAIVIATPQVVRLATPQPGAILVQRYGPVLAWLDANTATDDVVYADDALSAYIPAYTRDNVFFAGYAQQSYLSQDEVDIRYVLSHYFDGFSRESIIETEADVFGSYYVGRWQHTATENKLRSLLGLPQVVVDRYPEAEISQLLTDASILRKDGFLDAVNGFRIDYLVWDTVAHPDWELPDGLTEVHEANGIRVFKLP